MKKKMIALLGGILMMGAVYYGTNLEVCASQTVQEKNLEINASKGNVDVKTTLEQEISCDYDKNKYTVDIVDEGENTLIEIAVKDNVEVIYSDRCIVYVPSNFDNITITANKAGVYMTDINAKIDINCSYGAASIEVPAGFQKEICYVLKNGSGKITTTNISDYTITGNIATSTVSAPAAYNFKKVYGKKEKCSYTSGAGTAQINVNIENSTVKFAN